MAALLLCGIERVWWTIISAYWLWAIQPQRGEPAQNTGTNHDYDSISHFLACICPSTTSTKKTIAYFQVFSPGVHGLETCHEHSICNQLCWICDPKYLEQHPQPQYGIQCWPCFIPSFFLTNVFLVFSSFGLRVCCSSGIGPMNARARRRQWQFRACRACVSTCKSHSGVSIWCKKMCCQLRILFLCCVSMLLCRSRSPRQAQLSSKVIAQLIFAREQAIARQTKFVIPQNTWIFADLFKNGICSWFFYPHNVQWTDEKWWNCVHYDLRISVHLVFVGLFWYSHWILAHVCRFLNCQARLAKDWSQADNLRSQLHDGGVLWPKHSTIAAILCAKFCSGIAAIWLSATSSNGCNLYHPVSLLSRVDARMVKPPCDFTFQDKKNRWSTHELEKVNAGNLVFLCHCEWEEWSVRTVSG